MSNHFIAIEGTIGVGKTTLVRRLQPLFDASILLEVVEDNPFLPLFYGDRERYAFQTQIFFLLSRYHQQHQAVPHALGHGPLVADYTFGKDEIFAWLNLKDDELAMYGRVHAALAEKLVKPDLIVHLVADHGVLMQRIAQRDRPYERNMDPAYIREVARAYDAWLSNLSDQPVLRIDTNHLDFLARDEDLQHIAGLIKAALAHQPARPASPTARDEERRFTLDDAASLADYQAFHRRLDAAKQFDPDLFYNYMLLHEEMGEVTGELIQAWRQARALRESGLSPADAQAAALAEARPALGEELADMLAYIFKLANIAGVDLESAYRAKMGRNVERDWPHR